MSRHDVIVIGHPEARALDVDAHMRAGEQLWAVGDITGKGQFTHVAVYQRRISSIRTRRSCGASRTHCDN